MGETDHAFETDRLADTIGKDVLADFLSRDQLALVVYHREGSSIFPLHAKQMLIIGREAPADIVLAERSLSRQHARLTVDAGVWIEDLESTNGTLVNGVRIQRAQLHLGDHVTLGGTLVALHALSDTTAKLRPIESHDRFTTRVNDEIVRARTFRRSCAVLMVQGERSDHVGRWRGRIERYVRPVDALGLYAADALEILLPEWGRTEAIALASTFSSEERSLRCGFAAYPDDGATADALISASRDRTRTPSASWAQPAAAPDGVVIAVSPKLGALYAEADRAARSDIAVLILGETGVGKELLAQRIHAQSRRSKGPLCPINCAAIPEHLLESVLFGHEKGSFTGAGERRVGLLESAHGGSVFLDEVGELPLAAQAALLRALDTKRIRRVGSTQEVSIDIRIIAATHRHLDKRRTEGAFREDLLYRLNTMTLRVPPLRERQVEIAPLAQAFIDAAAQAMKCEAPTLQPEAAALLESYGWPGNVRELRNAMERAVAICTDNVITPDELPEAVRQNTHTPVAASNATGPVAFAEAVRRYECDLIVDALRACNWNQKQAAERLGMPRRTLVYKMRAYGIRRLGYPAPADSTSE